MPALQGCLLKREKSLVGFKWSKKWVVFDGRAFMYFATSAPPAATETPRKAVPVGHTEVVATPALLERKLKKSHTFQVECPREDYTMTFACEDEQEQLNWVGTLQHAATEFAVDSQESTRRKTRIRRFTEVEARLSSSPFDEENVAAAQAVFRCYIQPPPAVATVGEDDLRDVLRHLGCSISTREVQHLYAQLVPKGRSGVTETAFMKWWSSHQQQQSAMNAASGGRKVNWDSLNSRIGLAADGSGDDAPELVELKRLLRDLPKRRDPDGQDWNRQFQRLMEQKEPDFEASVRKALALARFVGQFLQTAVAGCHAIVDGVEEGAPQPRPLMAGDELAGHECGEALFLFQGLLFRVAHVDPAEAANAQPRPTKRPKDSADQEGQQDERGEEEERNPQEAQQTEAEQREREKEASDGETDEEESEDEEETDEEEKSEDEEEEEEEAAAAAAVGGGEEREDAATVAGESAQGSDGSKPTMDRRAKPTKAGTRKRQRATKKRRAKGRELVLRRTAVTHFVHRKLVGHETRAVNWFSAAAARVQAEWSNHGTGGAAKQGRAKRVNLCTTLTSVVDYHGFRLHVSAVPPVDASKSLVLGVQQHGAAVTLVDKDPKVRAQLAAVGEAMNLQSKSLPDATVDGPPEGATTAEGDHESPPCRAMPVGGSVQVHKGSDGRNYVLNLATILPPDLPRPNTHQLVTHRLRPELVQLQEEPLAADAFRTRQHGGGDEREDTKCVHASRAQLMETAQQLAQRLDSLALFTYDSETLTAAMHGAGLGMRHLGRLFELCTSAHAKTRCLIEAIARTAKHLLSAALRRLPPPATPADVSGSRTAVANFVNLVVGSSAEAESFWTHVLPPALLDRFGTQFEFALVRSALHLPELLLAMQRHCGFILRDADDFDFAAGRPVRGEDVLLRADASWAPDGVAMNLRARLEQTADDLAQRGYFPHALQALEIVQHVDEMIDGQQAYTAVHNPGAVLFKVAQCCLWTGDLDSAVNRAKQALKWVPALSAFGARVHMLIMRLHYSRRAFDDATRAFTQAHRATRWAVGEHSPLFAHLFAVVADMHYENRAWVDAATSLAQARNCAEKVLGTDHLFTATLALKLGTLASGGGPCEDTARALELLRRSLGVFANATKVHGVEAEPQCAQCEFLIASMHARARQFDHALEFSQRALSRRTALLAPDHDDLRQSQLQLVAICEECGEHLSAVACLEDVIATLRKLNANKPTEAGLVHEIQHYVVRVWRLLIQFRSAQDPAVRAALKRCAGSPQVDGVLPRVVERIADDATLPSAYLSQLFEQTTEDATRKSKSADLAAAELSCVLLLCSSPSHSRR